MAEEALAFLIRKGRLEELIYELQEVPTYRLGHAALYWPL